MSVWFMLGAGGSGKSTALRDQVIRESLKDPASRHIVFVPEQSTFTTQQAFTLAHPRHAMLNIEVVSFAHLAQRVFREFSAEKTQILGENGKRMLLALAAGDRKDKLNVYAKQTGRPGFLAKLGSLFAEWDMNDVTPERLEEIAAEENITPLLSAKLKDLAGIYRAFKERLGQGRATAEETLPRLLRLLPRSDYARGANLYFDGFTGFTTVQYRIITELIRRSRDSWFVFTLPKQEAENDLCSGSRDLFGMSAAAIRSIERCAEEAGKLVRGTVYAEDASPAEKESDLAFLEKHLMRFGQESFTEKPQYITAVACRNLRTECRAAVLEVQRLAREEGCAWREIAVTVGDREKYVPALEEDLREAGIPYFTDRRAPLGRHPLIRMLEAALEAACGNFERDSVLRYLKNECGPLTREECDRFENYLLAAGIRSGRKRMTGPYDRLSRDRFETDEEYETRKEETLAFMNGCRERAMTPLLALNEAVKDRGSKAGDMAGAVLAFLETLDVKAKLEARAEACKEAGRTAEAEEWEGVYRAVTEFFTEMQELLPGMDVSAQDFCLLAKSGLDSLKLGRLPAEPDQLVIGDVERSRYNDVKALLVLGLNEGVIPAAGRSGGIITDRERVQLEAFEPDLGYTDERALLEERFYIYRLLTRPTKWLYLSFPQTGSDGKSIRKSPVMNEIEALFPQLAVRDHGELCRREPLYAVAGEETAARVLAEQIRRKQDGWEELYALLSQQPDFAARLEKLEQGALRYYDPVPLTKEQAQALFGRVLRGSVTRLERFAECPYRHFLQYGLGLSEREEFSWEATDRGTFFHKVMETILSSLKADGKKLKDLSEDERSELIGKGIEAAETDGGAVLKEKSDSAYLLGRWKDLFTRQIEAMAQMEQDDGFVPESFELGFGGPKDGVILDLGEGRQMSLSGQIDRLDVWKNGETDWIRVVDYKTSDHSINYTDLHAGLQLQLFTYLAAALAKAEKEGRTVKPGGLYYAVLTDKWTEEDSEDPDKVGMKLRQEYRLTGMTASEVKDVSGDVKTGSGKNQGLTTSDMLEKLCDFVRGHEIRLGKELLDGKIAAEPAERGRDEKKNACTYCEFKSVCRFDERIPGMKTRKFAPCEQKELIEEISAAAAEKEATT